MRDEEGRRRFHGAFTGGFSAGFYNTAGSKDGMLSYACNSSVWKCHGRNGCHIKQHNLLQDGRHRHLHRHEKVELNIRSKAYITFLMKKTSRYVILMLSTAHIIVWKINLIDSLQRMGGIIVLLVCEDVLCCMDSGLSEKISAVMHVLFVF